MYERETMTRADAIKELKEMRTDPWTDNRQMEAIDMAINSQSLVKIGLLCVCATKVTI